MILNYGTAILSVAAAAAMDFFLNWLWGIEPTVSLFLCAIVFVAWAEGPGPALLATALAVFSFYYFFLPPFYSLAPKYGEIPRLTLFALAALFVLSLGTAQRRTAASLRLARDQQQETVKELQELNDKLRIEIGERRQADEKRNRAEAQLAETQRELQLTIDSIPVMVSTFEPDGTRSFINQTWKNYTGHSHQEATGKGLDTSVYYHPDDIQRFEDAWRAAQAKGEMLSVDVRTRRADGTYRWYTMRRAPRRDENGNVVKWYSVGVDIEDQKVAEDAARKSQEALYAAQTALAHASRVATLGEISASIAHEVNQPLAAIVATGQACLRFLRSEAPNLDDVRGAVEWIVKDGRRAGEVIRRVRGLLRKSTTEKTQLDVKGLIDEVATLLQHELSAQLVTLQLELATAPPPVFADRIQLQQVIINLVMNSIDAMQTITDRPRILVIQSYNNDAGQVVVAVKDNGVGIPQENVGQLFDAFFSTKPGGLGIGLSVCRSIIADHGGSLWTTNNRDGPGATFQFSLPTHQGARGDPAG